EHVTTEDEVIRVARGADAILIQYAPVTAAVLDALPQLKAVGRYGVGVDTVDVEAATSRGVAVCNVPDHAAQDVSAHALALTLPRRGGVQRAGLRGPGRQRSCDRPDHVGGARHRPAGPTGLGRRVRTGAGQALAPRLDAALRRAGPGPDRGGDRGQGPSAGLHRGR